MQARSALFDLYGDYLRSRGGRAPVAALVRLLAPLEIAAPAVRTAVSRMVRQGWLVPVRLVDGPGYQLTVRAVRRLDEAAARIYRTTQADWDGQFDMLAVFDFVAVRSPALVTPDGSYLFVVSNQARASVVDLPRYQGNAADLARLLRCRVPFAVEGERVVSRARDLTACTPGG